MFFLLQFNLLTPITLCSFGNVFLADDYNVSGASSPLAAKIGPKPPPKPNKQRLSIAGSIAGSERLDEETTTTPTVPAPFEDEGEDGTEV